jgi:hypothetical protein
MSLIAAHFDMAPPEFAGRPRRSFSIDGTEWTVCEDASSRCGPALLFFAPGVARRVTSYPANWQDLADGELQALSWRR